MERVQLDAFATYSEAWWPIKLSVNNKQFYFSNTNILEEEKANIQEQSFDLPKQKFSLYDQVSSNQHSPGCPC